MRIIGGDCKLRTKIDFELVDRLNNGEEILHDKIESNIEEPSDLELILYAGAFTKDDKKGCALTLLEPATGKYKVLSREDDWIRTIVSMPDGKILYAGDFTKDDEEGRALTLLDPKTKEYKVLTRENDYIRSVAIMPDGQILYAGDFTKDDKEGRALTLLDSKTKEYKVLSRENDWILTAIPVSRKLFGGLLV